jgi:acetylornithine deacetylase/succinyl-diaminopimelate desuccinylase-like protein
MLWCGLPLGTFAMRHFVSAAAAAICVASLAGCATQPAPSSIASADDGWAEFRDLYKELVEINTTFSVGSCTRAAEAMKARLLAAGYPDGDLRIIVPDDRKQDGNLVAIVPGSDPSKKAIMLLAHIDVVEANRADWERDPFVLTEEDGFFYARGVMDDKAMAAIFTDSLVRYKAEGYQPERTLKMLLTCGEETVAGTNGVELLIARHRDLIDAEFAINEGGGGRLDGPRGRRMFQGVQAGEKLYQDFKVEITNPGGHSSRPVPDNAIYRLSAGLEKIQALEFPIEFNDATRGFLTRMGDVEGGQRGADMKAAAQGDAEAIARLKADPSINAILHTTCVATQLDAGHAPNALPQRATANVNCRIFPGRTPDEIRRQLASAIGDEGVSVAFAEPPETPAPPPALTAEIMGPIEALTAELFPGVPVIPTMLAGATDGRFMTPAGISTYGVSGIFSDPATTNAHGLNERIAVQSLKDGRVFLHRLVKMYAGGE